MRKTASLPQTPNKNGCQKTKNQKKRKEEKKMEKTKKLQLEDFTENEFLEHKNRNI